MASKSWKQLVDAVVVRLPAEFTLADVIQHRDAMAREYPNNRFIDAKIRQTLQILRNQGRIEFLGDGKYRRRNVAPAFSLLIDPTLAEGVKSQSHVTQNQLETWAELNLYCLACSMDSLERFPPNTPLEDFRCPGCDRRYQLKGTKGRFADSVLGAAYGPVIEAIERGKMPDYILVEYDQRFSSVWFVRAFPGGGIDESRVVARRPLSSTARRAGWVGCKINVAGLPHITIVEPQSASRSDVRSRWSALARSPSVSHR